MPAWDAAAAPGADDMCDLELQHLIWNLVFNGRLCLSPLSNSITDALDIGTGTGGVLLFL